jgi:arylsulfatase
MKHQTATICRAGLGPSLRTHFDVGEDTGTPVSEDGDVPFQFIGQIEKVIVNLGA